MVSSEADLYSLFSVSNEPVDSYKVLNGCCVRSQNRGFLEAICPVTRTYRQTQAAIKLLWIPESYGLSRRPGLGSPLATEVADKPWSFLKQFNVVKYCAYHLIQVDERVLPLGHESSV